MFQDRKDAGQKLAMSLKEYKDKKVIVYGLTRGGVPVAYEVSVFLNAPLEAFIVKKIGAPHQEELALGAVTEGDTPVIHYNQDILSHFWFRRNSIEEIVKIKVAEIAELKKILRQDRELLIDIEATAIIVDDGIATGSTMKAAVEFFKRKGQKKIVVAIPGGPFSVIEELKQIADDVVCVEPVYYMEAVGEFYRDFTQVESESVHRILKDAEKRTKKENH